MVNFKLSYKSNHNVVFSCKYPIIWCPKYRRNVLIQGVDNRLKDIIHTLCKKLNAEILGWKLCRIMFIY